MIRRGSLRRVTVAVPAFLPTVAFAMIVGTVQGCGSAAMDAPPRPVRLASTSSAVGQSLASLYAASLPGVIVTASPPETSRFNLRAVEQGAADVGFVRADLAYAAHRRGTPLHPQPHAHLRGLALMGMSVLHVVVNADGGVKSLADLAGERVGLVSVSPDATQRMAREGDVGLYRGLLMATGRVGPRGVDTMALTPKELLGELAVGHLEAALVMAAHPVPPPFFDAIDRTVRLRLLEIAPDEAARIRSVYPFFKPAVIPPGTYAGQPGPIRTVGVDFLLVCRDDLPEDVAYSLVRMLFEGSAKAPAVSEVTTGLDPALAPATPIALHPGAARYYRERELPRY